MHKPYATDNFQPFKLKVNQMSNRKIILRKPYKPSNREYNIINGGGFDYERPEPLSSSKKRTQRRILKMIIKENSHKMICFRKLNTLFGLMKANVNRIPAKV